MNIVKQSVIGLLISISYLHSSTILVPGNYNTIQQAIDASADGDSIAVASGTYYEKINFYGKNIKVVGEGQGTTIIDGTADGHGQVVIFESEEPTSTLLKNFTIQNGNAPEGGGILLSHYANPVLQNLTITNNQADNGGGIAIQSGSSPTLININIVNNTCSNNGGGLNISSGGSHVKIRNCTIENNTSNNQGGGLWSQESMLTVENSIVVNNISLSNQGGGFFVENAYPFVINNTEFESNQGQGLYINHGSGHRISNVICSNNSDAGFFSHYTGPYQISNLNSFYNANGGMYLVGSSPVISNSMIVNNQGSEPGIKCQSSSSPMIVNCTVANNRLETNYEESGSEIIVVAESHPFVENSIIWGSENQSHSVYLANWWGGESSIKFNYSILKGDQVGILNDYESGVSWGEGNVEAVQDPLFENINENNFNLLTSSPGIDWGNPANYHSDIDGTRNDIGLQGGQGIFLYIRGQDPQTWNGQEIYETNLNDFYMGYAGVNRSSRLFDLHVINNGSQTLTISNWSTTDDQFYISNYENESNNSYYPLVIEPFSSSWVNNFRQMWLNFSPGQAGNHTGIITLLANNENQEFNFTLNLTGVGYLIPESVINVPENAPNIQFAIDNSNSFDTIRVAPGTYVGNIYFQNKELYLVGDSDNFPTLTVNNDQGWNSVVNMSNSGNSLLKNFIITGGRGEWCGGCDMPDGDNYSGGGVFINKDNWNDTEVIARIKNLIIQQNTAIYGAGVFARKASVIIDNCIIKENIAQEEGNQRGMGGGIFLMHQEGSNSYDSKIRNTVVTNNYAHDGGSAVLWQNNWGNNRVTFENTVFQENSGHYHGGIWIMDGNTAFINTTIVDNITEWDEQNEQGSGISLTNGGRARIINSILHNNLPINLGLHGDSLFIDYSIVTDGQSSMYAVENTFFEWGQNISEMAPDLDFDSPNLGLMGYSVGIGVGSSNGNIGGWNYIAPITDINSNPRPNPEGTSPDIGAVESPLGRSEYRLEIDTVYTIHGDTALLSIKNISTVPLLAIDINIEGYHETLELLDIITDNSTLFGQNGWVTFYNQTEETLLTASAGTTPINTSGTLMKLKLAVSDLLVSQFIPITITEFTGDEDYTDFNVIPGGIQVVWGPEIDFSVDTTTGKYPLTVSFLDESSSGTFPIDTWEWNFGNDSLSSLQNPSFTYLYPGEYNISLRIEDGFELADSIFYPSLINVDTIFGDVSWNGIAQAFDASIILKHLVGVHVMTPLQIEIGDVSMNDTLSTLDASLILQHSVGLIENLPVNTDNQYWGGGNLTMDNQGIYPGMIVEVPINIDNGTNIFGFKGSINFDPNIVILDTLYLSNQFSNYYLEYNLNQQGTIMIAAAGEKVEVDNGNFMMLVFQVSDSFENDTEIELINWEWNDGHLINDPIGMVLTYGLDIENDLKPNSFALHQNYPNPFNPITQIKYDLPEPAFVEIKIYDLMGKLVRNLLNTSKDTGYHKIIWNATNNSGESVSAGMYICTIHAGEFNHSKKMLLLK